MAVNIKSREFLTHNDLVTFANASAASIVAITFDTGSGMFVLFYTV